MKLQEFQLEINLSATQLMKSFKESLKLKTLAMRSTFKSLCIHVNLKIVNHVASITKLRLLLVFNAQIFISFKMMNVFKLQNLSKQQKMKEQLKQFNRLQLQYQRFLFPS